jgi:multidrug resistance protein, MATE family
MMTSQSGRNVPSKPPAGSTRELLYVAVPLILSSGSVSLMHVVDRVFLAWHSEEATAAVLPAGLLHFTLASVAFGIANYVNTFVAQYEGADRKDRVAAAVWQGVYLTLIAGIVMAFCAPLAGPLFRLIDHGPLVQKLEADYFAVLCLGTLPMIGASVLSCFYSGRGRTVVVMLVNMVAAVINIGLDYVLIFGLGPIPELGIVGAAIATIAANVGSVALYCWLMFRGAAAEEYQIWQHRRFDRELFARLIRYGMPNGIMYFIDLTAFSFFILLIGQTGRTELAATNLAFNLNSLAFIPMMGVGTAVMTLVGTRIGEGRPDLAVRTTWTAFTLAGGYMLLFAGIYVLLPDVILYPYAAHTRIENFDVVRDHVVFLLRFVAVYSFFDAMVIVFGSAVRGAGDTRFSMLFGFLCGWLIMVVPTFVVWNYSGANLTVGWVTCTAYIIVLGIGFMIRFQGGHWKTMRVIEAAPSVSIPVAEGTSDALTSDARPRATTS